MRGENINNRGNIIVMFLFVMLSFAIISEVSATSEAGADGTGFDPSLESVNITVHDIAGESNDYMHNHDNDFEEDVKFHNEQNSLDNSPEFAGDKNIEYENLYEQDGNKPDNLSTDLFGDDKYFDGKEPIDFNLTGENRIPQENMPNNFNFSNDNKLSDIPPMDFKDDNFTAVQGGEAMNNIVSDLIGLNNIVPNFKNDDKLNNSISPANDGNVPNQPDFDAEKAPVKLPGDISKKVKKAKKVKKHKKKKSIKKAKKQSRKKPKKKVAKH